MHEEYPIGNGETIDLVILGRKKIAIEIETGKSDAIHNIKKCLDAGFDVVSVATNGKERKRIESLLSQFPPKCIQRVKVVCAFKERFSK